MSNDKDKRAIDARDDIKNLPDSRYFYSTLDCTIIIDNSSRKVCLSEEKWWIMLEIVDIIPGNPRRGGGGTPHLGG